MRSPVTILGVGNHYQLLLRILRNVEPDLKKGDSLDKRIRELSLALSGLTLSNFQINPRDAISLREIFGRMTDMGEKYSSVDDMDDDSDSSPPDAPEYNP